MGRVNETKIKKKMKETKQKHCIKVKDQHNLYCYYYLRDS